MKTKTNNKRGFYKLLIFSFVLLFNVNINIVDIFPDFIAWFILAKLFERAADSAAYFEEARAAFIKLGWVSLMKIPALVIIILIKGKNILDNDVFALASFTFGVIEAILTVTAVKYIFEAFFHLGERTDLKAAISPLPSPIFKKRLLPIESIKEYSYFFFILKSLLSFLPSFLILTKVSDGGYLITVSKHYPTVLICSQLIGLFVGVIWLLRIKKYTKALYIDGGFEKALAFLATEDSAERFEKKVHLRKINISLSLFAIASFFSFDLIFDNFNGIDIVPSFLFGIFLLIFLFYFRRHSEVKPLVFIACGTFIAVSAVSFVFSVSFLSGYEYSDLLKIEEARDAYILWLIFAALEFVSLCLFFLVLCRPIKNFILKNTGVDPDSNRYGISEKNNHAFIFGRFYFLLGFGALSALTKLIEILLNFNVKFLFTDFGDYFEPTPSIVASAVPWFGVVVAATSILFIGYTIYFTSLLKDEVKMKYTL